VRIFAAEISTTEFLLFSFCDDGSQKPSTAPGHGMNNAFLYHRAGARGHLNNKYYYV
jgi:hypothetical protein